MPTIAEQNKQDTDLMYTLLHEGKLDLMYLPAGVIAWLWDRPDTQVKAARDLAVAVRDISPVTGGAVLRSDQNILILKTEDGNKFNVYPDGGYGSDGNAMDIHGCLKVLDSASGEGDAMIVMKSCPMEGGDQPDYGAYITMDALASDTAREMKMDDPTALEADPSTDGPSVEMDGPFSDDKVGEALGDQEVEENSGAGGSATGIAGDIGTEVFGYEDEIPEIEAMMAEQFAKYGHDLNSGIEEVSIELEDEDTGEYLQDVPLHVGFHMTPTDMEVDIEVTGVQLARDLTFKGKRYRAGSPFPGWLIKHLPYQVLNRRTDGEAKEVVFHKYLTDKLKSENGRTF